MLGVHKWTLCIKKLCKLDQSHLLDTFTGFRPCKNRKILHEIICKKSIVQNVPCTLMKAFTADVITLRWHLVCSAQFPGYCCMCGVCRRCDSAVHLLYFCYVLLGLFIVNCYSYSYCNQFSLYSNETDALDIKVWFESYT